MQESAGTQLEGMDQTTTAVHPPGSSDELLLLFIVSLGANAIALSIVITKKVLDYGLDKSRWITWTKHHLQMPYALPFL